MYWRWGTCSGRDRYRLRPSAKSSKSAGESLYGNARLARSIRRCSVSLAATMRRLTLFMMAAFLNRFLPSAFCFAHNAIFEVPRLMMCVGGDEYGQLRREVMRSSRSRRFFFRKCSDPSPSTSVTGRDLLLTLERVGDLAFCGDAAEVKDSRCAGMGLAVKVKTFGGEADRAVCQANLILTAARGQHVRKPSGVQRWES